MPDRLVHPLHLDEGNGRFRSIREIRNPEVRYGAGDYLPLPAYFFPVAWGIAFPAINPRREIAKSAFRAACPEEPLIVSDFNEEFRQLSDTVNIMNRHIVLVLMKICTFIELLYLVHELLIRDLFLFWLFFHFLRHLAPLHNDANAHGGHRSANAVQKSFFGIWHLSTSFAT